MLSLMAAHTWGRWLHQLLPGHASDGVIRSSLPLPPRETLKAHLRPPEGVPIVDVERLVGALRGRGAVDGSLCQQVSITHLQAGDVSSCQGCAQGVLLTPVLLLSESKRAHNSMGAATFDHRGLEVKYNRACSSCIQSKQSGKELGRSSAAHIVYSVPGRHAAREPAGDHMGLLHHASA